MATNDQNETLDLVESAAPSMGALEQMERASIDIQIATAKRYPRSLVAVKQRMLNLATLDEETAASCFYTLPPRKGGDGKALQGPSVRLAEIALASYQHLRASSRVIADDGKVLTAQAVVHDLENNVAVGIEVRRRVTNKNGVRYSDDMIVTTGNAACSIALRNSTFRVIPFALVKPIYEKAKALAVGDVKSLVNKRADALAHFAKIGVSKDRVFGVLNVKGIEDIGIAHLETLFGYATSIKDGEATVEEIFPTVDPSAKAGPSGGLAGLTGEAPKTEAKAPTAPASEAKTETAAPAIPDRDAVIAELKELMHAADVSEDKLFGYATRAKLHGGNIDQLFDLPTEVLAKLRYAVPTLKGTK